ncbi:MAG: sugar transferase [Bacteroidales bacterium]
MKFLFDRLVSLIGLVLLFPVLIIVAILIKIKMPGPVFYVQQRVGRNGKLFKMYKFRSMKVGSDKSSVSMAGESRITPLGAKLRKYKLDELPELWNVLIGNMSFVGPRPDVPGYADKLEGNDRLILKLRPGITGPASLKYRNEEEKIADYVRKIKATGDLRSDEEIALWYNDHVIYPDKIKLNLYYYQHYSFWMDIKMIFATIFGRKIKYAGQII